MDEWWKPLATLISQKRFWAAILLTVVTALYFHVNPPPVDVHGFEWLFLLGILSFWMLFCISAAQASERLAAHNSDSRRASSAATYELKRKRQILEHIPALTPEQATCLKIIKHTGSPRLQGARDNHILATLARLELVDIVANIDMFIVMYEVPKFVWDTIPVSPREAEEFSRIDLKNDSLFDISRRI